MKKYLGIFLAGILDHWRPRIQLVLSVVIAVHGFLNVYIVIAGCHNHINIKGWWKLKTMLGGNY